jgi:glycosyltransferase involved in cell wall biosynthesis
MAVEFKWPGANCYIGTAEKTIVATDLEDYKAVVLKILSGDKNTNRTLVSNHRTWQIDSELAAQAKARLLVIYRGTPVPGDSVRILNSSGELVYVPWEYMKIPPAGSTLVFPSQSALKAMVQVVGRHPLMTVVPNPVSPSWFDTDIMTSEPSTIQFISASRFIEWKRVVMLCKSVSKILKCDDRVRFELFGEGEQKKILDDIALEISSNRLKISEWNCSLQERYKYCSAFVSCSDIEAFGRVGAEALASGLPLIVPRSGGLGEMAVASKVGETFDVDEPEGCIKAMNRWLRLSDPERLYQRHLAREFAMKEFHSEIVARRWDKLIND